MKEYSCLACPKYVAIHGISVFIILLLESVFLFSSENDTGVKLLFVILSILIFIVPIYLLNRCAFSVTYLSKEGIRNKHLSFRWDEITSYHICEIDQRLGRKIKYPLIVCVGDVRSPYFGFCDPRKAVCFSLTKKNLQIIDTLCEEKNETIAELLTWVHFPMH